MATVSAIPSPVARYFNRARKRKNANNGGKNAPSSFWCNDDTYKRDCKIIARIPFDRMTRMDKKQFFYRIGWTTEAERAQESREAL